MPVAIAPVQRVAAGELTGSAYHRLAEALFGAANWSAHVRYCRWLLGDNPAGRTDGTLPLYVYTDGDDLAGQLAIVPADVAIAGHQLHAGWCVDFHVLPNHQRKGIGLQLLQAAAADFPLLLSLGQTEASGRLFRRCGWFDAGRLTVVAKPVSLWRLATNRILGRRDSVLRSLKRGDGFTPIAVADDLRRFGIDDWCTEDAPARVTRTADFVEWRYFRCPGVTYALRAVESRGQRACVVWRSVPDRRGRRARVVDFITPPKAAPEVVRRLIAATLHGLRDEGFALCDWPTSTPDILAALGCGVLTRQSPGARLIYGRMDGVPAPVVPIARWSLAAGDCDVDAMGARGGST